ncbi:MAG TPA: hypothetical protein DEB09_05010 [Candidatus Magasanikbacteria bacterium]|nr:hypothetical protein [Candidatus Magasanikbacteria bacterium]
MNDFGKSGWGAHDYGAFWANEEKHQEVLDKVGEHLTTNTKSFADAETIRQAGERVRAFREHNLGMIGQQSDAEIQTDSALGGNASGLVVEGINGFEDFAPKTAFFRGGEITKTDSGFSGDLLYKDEQGGISSVEFNIDIKQYPWIGEPEFKLLLEKLGFKLSDMTKNRDEVINFWNLWHYVHNYKAQLERGDLSELRTE